jgi:peptidoglycan-associated lipoprotein
MKRFSRMLMFVLAATFAFSVAGCAKKPAKSAEVPPAPAPTTETTPTPAPPPEPPPAPEPAKPAVTAADLQIVYFAYDSFSLDDQGRSALDNNAKLMRENPSLAVSVDGHCDERGTVEYNQALGQKRAEAVQQYLTELGLGVERFRVISYGKERPASEGHDEAAWARNRRVEFTPR